MFREDARTAGIGTFNATPDSPPAGATVPGGGGIPVDCVAVLRDAPVRRIGATGAGRELVSRVDPSRIVGSVDALTQETRHSIAGTMSTFRGAVTVFTAGPSGKLPSDDEEVDVPSVDIL